ncbi:MAG TPA: C-terminal helicase domain-containing protein, partial [Gemmatimonadales bacterium]|nr:C-terminal helicase domain-containing protein [Gemmatimonadales bacterium]
GDAARSGVTVTRQEIRRFVGSEGDQLVFWPLVAEGSEPDLALEDLDPAGELESLARSWSATPVGDAKLRALADATTDRKLTLVFTGALDTVEYLRRHLGGVAWCTGAGSGVDSLVLPRDQVLDWFRDPGAPTAGSLKRPSLLVATDVASEGLDLPLIERVVHYDLPWTAVRLDQRSGRAFRISGRQPTVEVLRFLPPHALEDRIRREWILEVKSGLPEALGLGSEPDSPWRHRAAVALSWRGHSETSGVGWVRGEESALVAGLRIELSDGAVHETVFAHTRGRWTDEAGKVAGLLDLTRASGRTGEPPPAAVRAALRRIAPVARAFLRNLQGGRLGPEIRSPVARRLRRRLLGLARDAARHRNHDRLVAIQRGLGRLGRGHTAGETVLIERLAALPVSELLGWLARLPGPPPTLEVERIGLVALLLVSPDPGCR